MDNVASLTASGDYVALPNEEHYRIYFAQIQRVCKVLESWAETKMGDDSPEAECVAAFGAKILQSIELLRLKYLAAGSETLKLDLNESGFPHFNEIVKLENDAEHAAKTLLLIPPRAMATEDALNQIFETGEVPGEHLAHLARRHFLEAFEKADFLRAFSFGEIKRLKEGKRNNAFACTWACYNPEDNLIYLHLLEFEQSVGSTPLEPGYTRYNEFLSLLQDLGNRAAPLVVLATEIDEAIDSIHPKVLRRIRVGPVLSSRFSFDDSEMARFLRSEGDPEDLIFSLESEVIVSSRQIVKERGWLFLSDTFREVFSIPIDDEECFDRRLSELHHFLFMPHRLWQTSLSSDNPPWLEEYADAERIAYDSDGEVCKI